MGLTMPSHTAGLTDADVQAYHRDSFVVARQLLPPALVADCVAQIDGIVRDQAAKLGIPVAAGASLDDVMRAVLRPGTPERSFVYNLVRHVQAARQAHTHPAVYEVLRALGLLHPICLELPSIRIDLPDEDKFLTGPHQDIKSIYCSRCITVWIPLVSCNAHDGTVGVFAGSHRDGLLDHGTDDEKRGFARYRVAAEIDSARLQLADVVPGDVVFLNAYAVHQSCAGTSGRVKIVTTTSFNDALAMRFDDHAAPMKLV